MCLHLTRRGILATTAVTATAFAGCGGIQSLMGEPDSGDIIIENNDSVDHSIDVTVMKVSQNPDDEKRANQTPTSTIWERELSYKVKSKGDETESDVISEPGTYYIEAEGRFDTVKRDASWLGVSSSGSNLGGGYVSISVSESKHLDVSVVLDD